MCYYVCCSYLGIDPNHSIWSQHQHTLKNWVCLYEECFQSTFFQVPLSSPVFIPHTEGSSFNSFRVQKFLDLRIQSSAGDSGQHWNSALQKSWQSAVWLLLAVLSQVAGQLKGNLKLPSGHTSAATTIFSFSVHTQHRKAFSHVQATSVILTHEDRQIPPPWATCAWQCSPQRVEIS